MCILYLTQTIFKNKNINSIKIMKKILMRWVKLFLLLQIFVILGLIDESSIIIFGSILSLLWYYVFVNI